MDPAAGGYRGLWRRRLLRDAQGEDRDTRVWWLQGDDYYVDLRQPPDRPDFAGVTAFDQLSNQQLAWLVRQQGFAGRLHIDGSRLHWQRSIDLQPPADLADIGTVHWDGACLLEQGLLAEYAEEWLWQPPAIPGSGAWATPDGRGLRVVVGEWFMQAVERRPALPRGMDLAALIMQPGADRAALLDCTIDFGVIETTDREFRIRHSSHPWREGRKLAELAGTGSICNRP